MGRVPTQHPKVPRTGPSILQMSQTSSTTLSERLPLKHTKARGSVQHALASDNFIHLYTVSHWYCSIPHQWRFRQAGSHQSIIPYKALLFRSPPQSSAGAQCHHFVRSAAAASSSRSSRRRRAHPRRYRGRKSNGAPA